jgi:hypothetical protein
MKPGLEALGYAVEDPGTKQRLRRPVLFGENGIAQVRYDVDAVIGLHRSRRDALDLHDGPLPLTPCGPKTK